MKTVGRKWYSEILPLGIFLLMACQNAPDRIAPSLELIVEMVVTNQRMDTTTRQPLPEMFCGIKIINNKSKSIFVGAERFISRDEFILEKHRLFIRIPCHNGEWTDIPMYTQRYAWIEPGDTIPITLKTMHWAIKQAQQQCRDTSRAGFFMEEHTREIQVVYKDSLNGFILSGKRQQFMFPGVEKHDVTY